MGKSLDGANVDPVGEESPVRGFGFWKPGTEPNQLETLIAGEQEFN
jgi:hypothetical protein